MAVLSTNGSVAFLRSANQRPGMIGSGGNSPGPPYKLCGPGHWACTCELSATVSTGVLNHINHSHIPIGNTSLKRSAYLSLSPLRIVDQLWVSLVLDLFAFPNKIKGVQCTTDAGPTRPGAPADSPRRGTCVSYLINFARYIQYNLAKHARDASQHLKTHPPAL